MAKVIQQKQTNWPRFLILTAILVSLCVGAQAQVPVVETDYTFLGNPPGSPGTDITLTKPSGWAVDDLFLVFVSSDSDQGPEWNTKTGWTRLVNCGDSSTNTLTGIYYRIADGTEGSTETFTQTNVDDLMGWWIRISGVDTSDPIHATTSCQQETTTTPDITGFNTTKDDVLAMWFLTHDGADFRDGGGLASGSGWPTDFIDGHTPSGDSTDIGGGWSQKNMASQGATGTVTVDADHSDGNSMVQIGINPVAGSGVALVGSCVAGTTHAAEAGSDRVLVLVGTAVGYGDSGSVITSATYGSQALSFVEARESDGSGYDVMTEVWILDEAGIAAASGSTFSVNWSGTPYAERYMSCFYTNVDQTTSIGAKAENFANAATPNPITTTALANSSGDMVLAVASGHLLGSYVAQNGFTEQLDVQYNGGCGDCFTHTVADKAATGANETPSMQHTDLDSQSIIGFVLQQAASSDSDGDLTASATITEPIAISSIADTVGERVAVFDFSIADGGTTDALALAVSQIVLNTSGTGTFADITWQLDGPDASFVTGTVGAGTITFSSLSISVADGASETYTVNAYFSTSPTSTDGQTFILSVDGDTDLTVGAGTQMGTTSAVNNSTGSTMDIAHSQLIFSTHPPASATTDTDFSGTIAVSATDVNNNVDIDFGETLTLSAVITATHTAPGGTLTSTDSGGTTKSPTNGVATWTDTKYDVGETIDIKAVSATTYTAGIFSTAVTVTVPPDADGDLTASATITEPIALSSIADTVGKRVAVFDFSISDGGTADALALAVSQVVLNTSGTGTFSDITWQLNGPDASFVTGTVGAGTITFSSLSIPVADGASETYTVYAYFSTSPTSTDGQTFLLSVDGDTDLTVGGSGTQMGTTSAVNNSTGSTMDVAHSKLIFSTQPPASATTDTDFSGTIAVSATDVNNNVDIDFGETLTLSAVITGIHTAPGGTLISTDSGGTTKSPTNGVATWTDTKYDVGETIDIKAVSATTYTTGIFSTSVTVAAISAAVTGTITPSATEAEIVSGGKKIVITLTGDTWVPGGSGFPQVQFVTETSFAAEPTSHLVQMPAIVDPGDLLVILVSLHQEPPSATPGGWSQLFLLALGADEFAAYAKDAVGDEDGTTVDVTTTIGASGAAQVYRITNWEGTLVNGVEVGTAVGAQGTTPDPPSLTASWGAENNLWLAVAGAADDDQAATAYPTNYTNGIDTMSGGGANSSAQVYSARRENAIATENPAVFTLATTEAWVANTIVIRPAPSTFDSERQNIINGLDSAQAEGNGWDIVVAGGIPVGNVARTSDTVVTITLPALAGYSITATETITAKVPATGLVLSGSELTASPTFDVTFNPATTLYRSVGTDNTDLNTGQTVQIVGTTATFSASMPNKIGVGDVLEYGSTNLAFISGRTSDTVYTVASSTGGTPVATGAGTPVSVFRAYTSLFNWEAQDENDAIDNTVENFDTSKDLVNDDTVMQVAAYADGPDTFASDVRITSAWVTGAINYIRIYTPVSSSEVGVS